MARVRKTTKAPRRVSFNLRSSARHFDFGWSHLLGVLKVLAAVCTIVAIGVCFVFLRQYVEKYVTVSDEGGLLELLEPPRWATEQLKRRVYETAKAGGENLKLDEDAAWSVQRNIATGLAWLDEIRVQTAHDRLIISARWRKPLVLLTIGAGEFYIDAELVALDYMPMPNLPIVKVTGVPQSVELPLPGQKVLWDDLAAGVAVLAQLDRMDELVTPEKPLLYEIASVDVGNFNGRQNERDPHIVLYTTDGTKIIWGAEMGTWQRYLEATDQEKLAKLYEYYREYGSLLNRVKCIKLRDPQGNIPLPVDRY